MTAGGLTTILKLDVDINDQNIRACSPLSAFNNFIQEISRMCDEVFYPDYRGNVNQMLMRNEIFFEDYSILFFNFIKLSYVDHGIKINFIGDIDMDKLSYVEKFIVEKEKIIFLFQKYLYIISEVSENYDHTIAQKYVDDIFKKVKSTKTETEMFLVPHKNKINHLFDNNDHTLEKLYNKFSYVITFINNKHTFTYKLMRVLSSDLDESKSLENIRFLEKETIKFDTINIFELSNFLCKLYYYGEI